MKKKISPLYQTARLIRSLLAEKGKLSYRAIVKELPLPKLNHALNLLVDKRLAKRHGYCEHATFTLIRK